MKIFIVWICIVLTFACKSQSLDEDRKIVLLNVGNSDRRDIAKQIELVNSFDPKVISMDLSFSEFYGDSSDISLSHTLWKCKNLVLPIIINPIGDGRIYFSAANSIPFIPDHAVRGYVSYESRDLTTANAKFRIKEMDFSNEISKYHFSVCTAMLFDSIKTKKFIDEHNNEVVIDFERTNNSFVVYSGNELLNGKVNKTDIKGNIVIFGYMGPDNLDKHFSPLNRNSKEPDMYGVEFLARIVAQILL